MKNKGSYKLKYKIAGKIIELFVEVILKQVEGQVKTRQNVWEGFAKVNGDKYEYDDLKYAVNATLLAQEIGLIEKKKLKDKYLRKMRIVEEIIK
jgi:hypothetical protein